MPAARRPIHRLLWLVQPLLLAAAAAFVWLRPDGDDDAAPARSAPVERGDIELSVTALGKIGPKTFVDVGAQVSGQLETVHVEVGERVAQGQLLAEIDPRLFQSRVEADRARVESLQAQLGERAAALHLARSQHERNQALVKRGLVARDLVDISEAALKQAQAQQGSLRAQLREAQSTLAGGEASLGYAKVYAPIAGTVVAQTALEGQTLNANQVAPTLMRIADLETMTVTAQVAEADVARIRVGMPAWFTTLGQPERRWQGTVRQVLPTPDILNEVVLYRALIDVANPDGALLPDMTAQVFFELDSARDTLTVPLAAVARERGGGGGDSYVRVVDRRGKVERRPVKLGLRDRERAQVLDGLREGERVLVPQGERGAPEQRRGFGLLGGGGRRR